MTSSVCYNAVSCLSAMVLQWLLQASRETIARLGEFAEVARRQTNSQLETMRHELDMEHTNSFAAVDKLHRLQVTTATSVA